MTTGTRETREAQIGGHDFVFKTYLTGREFNEIQRIYLSSAKINMVGNGGPSINSFSAEVELDATKKTLEMLVVSMDGSTENIVDRIEDLPNEVYQLVVANINEAAGKKKIA